MKSIKVTDFAAYSSSMQLCWTLTMIMTKVQCFMFLLNKQGIPAPISSEPCAVGRPSAVGFEVDFLNVSQAA